MSRANFLAYNWQALVAEMKPAEERFPCSWCTVKPLGNELLKYHFTTSHVTEVLGCYTYDLVLTYYTGIHIGFCSLFFCHPSLSQQSSRTFLSFSKMVLAMISEGSSSAPPKTKTNYTYSSFMPWLATQTRGMLQSMDMDLTECLNHRLTGNHLFKEKCGFFFFLTTP